MRHLTRIRIAAVSTAFFLGGLTAAGMGFRAAHESAPQPVTAHPRTEVIHETRTRTVHVRARRTKAPAAQPAQPARPVSEPQVPAASPATVQSRVSPTGGEREGGEHEVGEAGEVEALDD